MLRSTVTHAIPCVGVLFLYDLLLCAGPGWDMVCGEVWCGEVQGGLPAGSWWWTSTSCVQSAGSGGTPMGAQGVCLTCRDLTGRREPLSPRHCQGGGESSRDCSGLSQRECAAGTVREVSAALCTRERAVGTVLCCAVWEGMCIPLCAVQYRRSVLYRSRLYCTGGRDGQEEEMREVLFATAAV